MTIRHSFHWFHRWKSLADTALFCCKMFFYDFSISKTWFGIFFWNKEVWMFFEWQPRQSLMRPFWIQWPLHIIEDWFHKQQAFCMLIKAHMEDSVIFCAYSSSRWLLDFLWWFRLWPRDHGHFVSLKQLALFSLFTK